MTRLIQILLIALATLLIFGSSFVFQFPAGTATPPPNNGTVTLPSGVLYFVPIVIKNTETKASPSPFQQMLVVDSQTYSSYESARLTNVEFSYSNGQIVPSWLESGNSYKSKNTIYWLKIETGIPAESNITLYMDFASKATNLMNAVTTGEAPELSTSYGLYDNGRNVFNFYDNFAGHTLSSSWSTLNFTVNGGEGTYSVDNGINISASEPCLCGALGAFHVYTDFTKTNNVLDMFVTSYNGTGSSGSADADLSFDVTPPANVAYADGGFVNDYRARLLHQNSYDIVKDYGGAGTETAVASATKFVGVLTAIWPRTGLEEMQLNYRMQLVSHDSQFSHGPSYIDLSIVASGAGTYSFTASWVRARAYPPDGLMPIVTFEPVQSA